MMSDDSKVEGSKTDLRVSLAEDRTEMATFRTSLSLDRTTLAWVRTTLAMSSFGLGIIGFFRTVREQAETAKTIRMHEGAIHFGLALVVIGVVSTVLVAISHLSMVRKLRAGEMPLPTMWPLSITVSLLLALLALGGLWVFYLEPA
jgi:putative membrane protein